MGTPIFRVLRRPLGRSNYACTCSNYDIQRFQKKHAICLIVKDIIGYAAPARLPRRSRTHPGNAFWAHFCQGGPSVGLILPKSLLSLWSSRFFFQNKNILRFVKDIHEYAARRKLSRRSLETPRTLQDTPWLCFLGPL